MSRCSINTSLIFAINVLKPIILFFFIKWMMKKKKKIFFQPFLKKINYSILGFLRHYEVFSYL